MLFTIAFLAQENYFNIIYALPIVFLGVFMGDFLWYWLGLRFKNSKSRFINWIARLTAPFDAHLMNYPSRTLFFSRFVYGLYHVLLLRTGILNIKLRQFIKTNLVSTISWIFVIGGLGYFSGFSFLLLKRYLRFSEFGLLIGVVIFLMISHFFSLYSKRKDLI